METRDITVTVNGVTTSATVEPRRMLSDFLRHDLRLTGTHVGCEHGVCGACTVLMDGKSVRACLAFAVQADGKSIETVEGLTPDNAPLTPLQQSLSEHHGLQCGFCTAGILMSLTELLRETPNPDEETIRDSVSGNMCRCTGYQGIVDAVLALTQKDAA